MTTAAILAIALILDALFGEPEWLWRRWPHPAVMMGALIAHIDRRFNEGAARRWRGIAAMAVLSAGAWALGLVLDTLPAVAQAIVVAVLLAQRSLCDHLRDVALALRRDLPEGRRMVARIVGRDVETLDRSDVARAAIESGAENLSDGIVAPALWFLVFGLPGLIFYKITNTADSMIGYRTERHAEFGWAAARLDDVVNWLPARATAVLIALSHASRGAIRIARRDARLHRSPNAGWPEAAMAAVLNVALAGPRYYHGELTAYPLVHPEGRKTLCPQDIEGAIRVLWRVWLLLLTGAILLAAPG
ncbi:adenosylcobinamide-phosphate synthase CbiB [Brevirhabdus sp.]|uniref:adenosylcobinamide-phosphate synthase CbiB n=1 Tax=Brevirhabdus sp. TaxID=2004514 RepID=UPI004059C2E0